MEIPARGSFALLLCLGLTLPTPAHAGPLQPCITSTLSANHNVLVVNQLTFDDPDETHPRMPKTSSFHIYTRYVDPNDDRRVNAPLTYWADSRWSVVLTNGEEQRFRSCPYTLVTDDAEFLVLIDSYWGPFALSIYRRRDHLGQIRGGPGPDHGVFIRQVPMSDLFSLDQIPDGFGDETPPWFAYATFQFSPDNQTLRYTPRSGTPRNINLESGAVEDH